MKACCYSCGMRYDSDGWADVVIPDAVWKLISPTGGDGGLLCFACMNARLSRLGLRNVPFQIASGPFSFMPRDVTGATKEAVEVVRGE